MSFGSHIYHSYVLIPEAVSIEFASLYLVNASVVVTILVRAAVSLSPAKAWCNHSVKALVVSALLIWTAIFHVPAVVWPVHASAKDTVLIPTAGALSGEGRA